MNWFVIICVFVAGAIFWHLVVPHVREFISGMREGLDPPLQPKLEQVLRYADTVLPEHWNLFIVLGDGERAVGASRSEPERFILALRKLAEEMEKEAGTPNNGAA